ncbi:LiaF transmembrane domain-containing protein [Pontibacter akesuensis]|uniref:LiaF transmembrane domain-containing protein n=1 Tax=Pontibacter akesuensis TaxID=388950 RepID=A0A1I7ICY3_9BACT|nr:hypothetical protein [Pontibacter akesuensis]GHA66411.1 membrane protein [Pontibacter akesuensis]SFU70686.1 hypothetical protein SAMN04487941_2102 [Pontibacter akesuensis]
MENQDQTPNSNYGGNWDSPRRGNSGKVLAGLLLVAVGVVLLVAKLNIFFLPYWVFSWEMLLIVLGLFLGFRHNFQKPGWIVLVLIGSIFLLDDLLEGFDVHVYFWPIMLIGVGLWVMLKPRRDYPRRFRQKREPVASGAAGAAGAAPGPMSSSSFSTGHTSDRGNNSSEEVVDVTAILGGIKKNIISKNFMGGEVVSVFGGTELNLTQADIQRPVVLEATQIFGGTTLIIPPHWEVKSEMVAILGGIDDKRPILSSGYDPSKVLIIKGTTLFGGLQIKSY